MLFHRIIGYIGISTIIANGIATFVVSRIVDRMKGKMKQILLTIMLAAVACWIWLGLICLKAIPFSLGKKTIAFSQPLTKLLLGLWPRPKLTYLRAVSNRLDRIRVLGIREYGS